MSEFGDAIDQLKEVPDKDVDDVRQDLEEWARGKSIKSYDRTGMRPGDSMHQRGTPYGEEGKTTGRWEGSATTERSKKKKDQFWPGEKEVTERRGGDTGRKGVARRKVNEEGEDVGHRHGAKIRGKDSGERGMEERLSRQERHRTRQELGGYRGMDVVEGKDVKERAPIDFRGKERNSQAIHKGNLRRWKEDPNKPEMVAGERLADGGQVERRPLQLSSVPPSVEQQLSDLERAKAGGEDRITRRTRARHYTGREDAA